MSKDKSAPHPEPEKFDRWAAQRKAAIILEVLKGKISVPKLLAATVSHRASIASGPRITTAAASRHSRPIAKTKTPNIALRSNACVPRSVSSSSTMRSARERCGLFFRAIRRRACGRPDTPSAPSSLPNLERPPARRTNICL